jgi:hypothetical protein
MLSEVKSNRQRNRSRKNICEILRQIGNLDRATILLHTRRAHIHRIGRMIEGQAGAER